MKVQQEAVEASSSIMRPRTSTHSIITGRHDHRSARVKIRGGGTGLQLGRQRSQALRRRPPGTH
eukprot:scaffold1800_cov387-Prasinococcus_capsulatus_cf.AAC.6